MTLSDMPAVNASLNALSAVFIVLGLILIKAERKLAHAACMTLAVITSTLFLGCYLTYHYFHGRTLFTHPGWPSTVYFSILLTHTPLAVIMLPFIVMTVLRAIQARFESHRRWAKWTFPMWLYVSVTGVLVYFMLYVWFPTPTVAH